MIGTDGMLGRCSNYYINTRKDDNKHQRGGTLMKRMKMESRVLLVLVFVALIAEGALAAQHIVGGSQGWEESADFDSWASSKKFKVGDQIVFKYTSGLHSVVELAVESAYKNCDIGSAIDSMNTGNDVVKLNKVGTRYFACGTLGHCDQGMKVKITTEAGTAPSTPDSSSSPPAASSASHQSFACSFVVFAALVASSLYYMF